MAGNGVPEILIGLQRFGHLKGRGKRASLLRQANWNFIVSRKEQVAKYCIHGSTGRGAKEDKKKKIGTPFRVYWGSSLTVGYSIPAGAWYPDWRRIYCTSTSFSCCISKQHGQAQANMQSLQLEPPIPKCRRISRRFIIKGTQHR